MKIKHTLMATTAALVLTASGFAQAQQGTTAPRDMPAPIAAPSATSPGMSGTSSGAGLNASVLHEIKDNKAKVAGLNNMRVKDLNDMAIYGSDGKKIGEIDRVLGDSSNTPKAVAIDAGGFLGIGTHEVVFPLDKLQKGKEAKRLQTSLTKDQIKALNKWENASNTNSRSDQLATQPSTPARPATPTPNR